MNSPNPNMTFHPQTANSVHCDALRADMVKATVARSERVTVKVITSALYALAIVQDPHEPEDRRIHRMARLERIARMAVALISEANEREAERLANLSFDDALNGCEAAALVLDADHSRRNLVEAFALRLRQIIQNQKPVSGALSVFQTALVRKGGVK